MKIMVSNQAQLDVLVLAMEGHTQLEVGVKLGRTYEAVSNVLSKLRARNGDISRLELLRRASEHGYEIVSVPRGKRGPSRSCVAMEPKQIPASVSRSEQLRNRESAKRAELLAQMGRG